MQEQEFNQITDRLGRVERTLFEVNHRLDSIERVLMRGQAPRHAVQPPPFVAPIPSPTRQSVAPQQQTPMSSTTDNGSLKRADDLEYKIGLTGLLRGGAVVIVIAMIYLVAYVVSKGYITPQIQFAGEIALCLGFIGLGVAKRNEREEFGQLMMGIGSCGLYLSFAGGHLFKHLYAGETLVALFVALSFANLGVAIWRSSRSFLAIGMIGGFTAAMLPMHQFKVTLDVGLHFLILVPTALIILRNRWKEMAIALWVASTAALVPALTYNHDWAVRISGLYGTSLICAAVYAAVWTETEFDPWCGLSAAFLVAAGILGLAFDSVQHGSLHVLALAAVAGLSALAFASKPAARNGLAFGALAVATALAPVGFHRLEAGSAFAILSIVVAAASLRWAPKAFSGLACLELGMALCAYTAPWTNSPIHFGLGAETWLLCILMAASVALAYASHRAGGASERMLLAGSLVLFPLFSRLGYVLLTSSAVRFAPPLALLIPFFMFSVGMLAIGRSTRWATALGFGWVALVLSLGAYNQLISEGFESPGLDTAILLSLVAAALYAAVSSSQAVEKSRYFGVLACSGAMISVLLVRLSVVWLTLPVMHLTTAPATAYGCLLVAFLSGYLALKFGWECLVAHQGIALSFAYFIALAYQMVSGNSFLVKISLLAASIAGVILMAKTVSRMTSDRRNLTGFSVFGIWVLFSCLAFDFFTGRPMELQSAPALTLAWIVYAFALIALGFWYRARYLRYWSFGVFGSSLLKIFVWDLSALDPGIRVVLLLVLGFCMVGGGYWYIRARPVVGADANAPTI